MTPFADEGADLTLFDGTEPGAAITALPGDVAAASAAHDEAVPAQRGVGGRVGPKRPATVP